jgi:hypothetical protein
MTTFARGREMLDTPAGKAMKAMRGQDWGIYTSSAMHIIHGWEGADSARRMADLMRKAVTPEDGLEILRAVEAFDVSELPVRVRVPTLVTYPEGSSFVLAELGRAVAAAPGPSSR